MEPIDILKGRADHRNRVTSRTSDARLALVIEGGGMRAVLAAGMAEGLQRRGLDLAFDSYHGSSAGAIIGAYTAAGQASTCAEIFCNEAASKRFINPARLLLAKPIMDIHWMIHKVVQHERPLDAARLMNVKAAMHVVATSVTSASAVEFSHFQSPSEILTALEASAFLPLVAGRYLTYRDNVLIDGGLAQRVALESAIASGATHVIMLLTQRWADHRTDRVSTKECWESSILGLCYGKSVADLYIRRNILLDEVFRTMSAEHRCSFKGVKIQAIFPGDDAVVPGRLTTDRRILHKAREAGRIAIDRLVG